MLPNIKTGNGHGVTTSSSPDFLIEGKPFDCYSPNTNNVRNIASEVERKTIKQATRVVLNLDDYPGTMDDLVKQFYDWPLGTLDELLVIKNGKISRIFIK